MDAIFTHRAIEEKRRSLVTQQNDRIRSSVTLLEEQRASVEQLARFEDSVSTLYTTLCERFPEYTTMLANISKDERKHARWLRELIPLMHDGGIEFVTHRFDAPRFHERFAHLQAQLAEVQQAPLTAPQALRLALAIENYAIERPFSELFTGETREARHTLHVIALDESEHYQIIRTLFRQAMGRDYC